ncbi:hypothetical protein Dde_2699 [Oleidesulfovibrio alaskensis G20]|jgi:hypothetical protein|uniref:ATP synthase I chain n=1 Tax=Oleidesulfovibrio alaskensis (strain ATCC BAA-1058 / DSM 17464 / G20) TaxID=207559 RepID=Q30XV1_OLEA2|nr:hypothetical protein [Oleidesulfovibrio alaskensis]ABB39495.1 hypothetical protein Dde_2699 [Oleidesulfovibrio alaskensis G20]MBG0772437.1 ATP synthase subunit I [Oleidesulfovibrio alaskensis]
MLRSLILRIDRHLWTKGFKAQEIRTVARNQILLTLGAILAAAALGWKFQWLFWFALCAGLALWNFYSLAQFIQHLILRTFTRDMVLGMLLRFYGRLGVTGITMAGLIVWLDVSPFVLIAGFSTVVATTLVWGLSRLAGHKVKEA